MGYNTQILVLNDGWDQCMKNPEEFTVAVDRLVRGDRDPRGGVGNHGNVVSGLRTAHADTPRVIVSCGNLMMEMSKYNEKTMEMATRNDFTRDEVLARIRMARWHLDELEKEVRKGDHAKIV